MADDGSVWVKVYPEFAGGGSFDVATVVTAPTQVSGENDVVTYDVTTTDGASKKLYALLGNTGTNAVPTMVGGIEVMSYRTVPAVFQVTLSRGRLPGVMVASGGPGGYNNTSTQYGGGGGAGGVVGLGCNAPVFLNKDDDATYEITVGGTSVSDNENHIVLYGQSTSIAAQGEAAFMAAVGGGGGRSFRGGQYIQPSNGGSGGGGMTQDPDDLNSNYARPGDGVPGQGHPGGLCQNPFGGGGGGYGGTGNVPIGSGGPFNIAGAAGGPGMSVTTALGLDESDAGVQAFMAACTANGMIAGGGSSTTDDAIDGGGSRGNAGVDWTGAGGGGGGAPGYGGNGAAGAVYLLGEV
jgi:hypothetical protein